MYKCITSYLPIFVVRLCGSMWYDLPLYYILFQWWYARVFYQLREHLFARRVECSFFAINLTVLEPLLAC